MSAKDLREIMLNNKLNLIGIEETEAIGGGRSLEPGFTGGCIMEIPVIRPKDPIGPKGSKCPGLESTVVPGRTAGIVAPNYY